MKFRSPSYKRPGICWKKSGFPVEHKEIFNHGHNDYEISETVNEDVWHFLEAKRIP